MLDVPDWAFWAPGRALHHLKTARSGLIRLERTPQGLRRVFSPRLAELVRRQEARLQQALGHAPPDLVTPLP